MLDPELGSESRVQKKKKVVGYGKLGRSRLISRPSRDQHLNSAPSQIGDAPLISENDSPSPLKTSSLGLDAGLGPQVTGFTQPAINKNSTAEGVKKRKHEAAFVSAACLQTQPASAVSSSIPTSKRPVQIAPSSPDLSSARRHMPPSAAFAKVVTNPSQLLHRPSRSLDQAGITDFARPTQSAGTPSVGRSERTLRKSRLIDKLSAQRADSPDSVATSSEDDPIYPGLAKSARTQLEQTQPTANQPEMRARSQTGIIRHSTGKPIKHTYSSARVYARKSGPQPERGPDVTADSQIEKLLSSPPRLPSPDPFSFPTEEYDDVHVDGLEDAASRVAIKSVHELRRAGANHRFADEMEDLVSRVGSPARTTVFSRRNALLDLAGNLRNEDFAFQFRNHPSRDNTVRDIGKESDLVSGFVLVATLIMLPSLKASSHLLRRLVSDGVGKLIGQHLHITDDIDDLACRDTANITKITRKSLSAIRLHLLKMPIWHECKLRKLSPRSLSLLLLNILLHSMEGSQQDTLLKQMNGSLEVVVDHQAHNGLENDVDLVSVVSILESLSKNDKFSSDPTQIQLQASNRARLLLRTLQKWPSSQSELEMMTLKMAINTTNTKPGAIGFAEEDLMAHLVRCICLGTKAVQEAVEKSCLKDEFYNRLILILGVTINILEHCPAARGLLGEAPLKSLSLLYLKHHTSVRDADSEAKSRVSVGFGYMAVVLGYLSLHDTAREVMARQTDGRLIRELTNSIRNFIGLYRHVDDKAHELEGLVVELQHHCG